MPPKLLVALCLPLLVLLAAPLLRSSQLTVTKTAVIAAPRELVFEYLDDFRRWGEWSPWERLDPQQQRTYQGPPKGVGASYTWSGDDRIGAGRLSVTEANAPSKLIVAATLEKPIATTGRLTFDLAATPAGTAVTWTAELSRSYREKFWANVVDGERVLGLDLERGLADLDFAARSEAARRTPPAPTLPGEYIPDAASDKTGADPGAR